MDIADRELVEIYRWMVLERMADQRVDELFRMGKIMSMYHSGQGQESCNIGSVFALQPGDALLPSHRTKATYLMRGVELKDFMAGMFGKREGINQGRSPVGSHMTGNADLGLIPVHGAVASSVTMAVGAALAFKLQKKPNVVLVTSGDGGSNRADFHEGMNFAAVFKLPIVFFFVHNGWAISVPASLAMSVENISDRAAGYGMPGVTIDGRDVLAVYETISEALERARGGGGPSLVEAKVSRWKAHSGNDPDIYRTDEMRAEARKIDPIAEYEKYLVKRGLLSGDEKEQMHDEIEAMLAEAIAYADSCSEPSLENLTYGVNKYSL